VAPPVEIELENLKVYGLFVALDITGQKIQQGAGQGKVVALGFEVQNYASGPVLKVGEDVLFRDGTQIKFVGGAGKPEIVFVALGDILAQLKTPEDMPVVEHH
jgi:co-chaperonin GroES (HSP10)